MSQVGGTPPADNAKTTVNKMGGPEAKTAPHIKTTAEPRIRDLQNDPARTGFDPARAWWLNYLAILTGRITAEGTFHYREWRYAVNEARDCRQCERWRDFALRYSPTVRFLADKIADLNGRIDSTNVYCRRCPARLDEDGTVYRQGGGFSPEHGILICANEVINRKHLEDTLAHEMVHAWDALRWKVDYTGERNLRHAACTEIRASMLSGECRWWRWGTIARAQGDTTIAKQFQKCVRTRAMLSVMARPTCRDAEHAARLVDQVWDSCFADTRPFDEVDR